MQWGKNLAQQIAQNKLKFNDYIRNSENTVATSKAVKTAFDKAEDAIRNMTGNLALRNIDNEAHNSIIESDGIFNQSITSGRWDTFSESSRKLKGVNISFDASRIVPTANENRPKSLILKLCIKAQNSFDDVKFWVKAFGAVDNEGLLVASQLAQSLQGKAERNHTHTVAQMTDFNQKTDERINAALIYEERNGFTIRKYPDGTMIQTYRFVPPSTRFNTNGKKWTFNWAQSFVNKPQIFHQVLGMYTNETIGSIDTWITIQDSQTTNSAVAFWNWENQYNNELIGVDFLAIGRWK